MATEWKSQQCFDEGKYYLQFETDDKDKFKFMEKSAQSAIDGKLDSKTEVAREIFAEIEDTFVNKVSKGIQERNQDWWLVVHIINKLKTKYTKGGARNETVLEMVT